MHISFLLNYAFKHGQNYLYQLSPIYRQAKLYPNVILKANYVCMCVCVTVCIRKGCCIVLDPETLAHNQLCLSLLCLCFVVSLDNIVKTLEFVAELSLQ